MSPSVHGAVSPSADGAVRRSRRLAPLALTLALAVTLSGCGGLRSLLGPPPESHPGEKAGWLAYRVEGLRFEAPAGWRASGDARRVTLEADGLKLEAWVVDGRFDDARACLEAAEESLARGAERLSHVRRHPSALAGRKAVTQEADAGGWHGWAYGVCDGPVQYRLFFTGRSPIPAEALEAWRGVVASARLGGVS